MSFEYKKVDIYCFSGTGNTLMAARRMESVFTDAGLQVVLRMIPCDFVAPEAGTLCVFAFPVYEQSIPAFAYDWLAGIPRLGASVPVCVLTTMAGKSGFVKTPLRCLLAERNFSPVAVREILMPPNYLLPQSKRKMAVVLRRGLRDASEFAKEIFDGTVVWPPPSRIVAALFPFVRFAGRLFTRLFSGFHSDTSCVKCGLCAGLCPVDNISASENGMVWGRNCQLCLRCVNFCPHNAVRNRFGGFLIHPYRAEGVKADDLLES
ncbi:MAG: EFR1 family ferrodoxin [Victivallales bacterium]|nr:EFR1 family ferrodoxin [Victivallales bacterium]